MADSAVRLTLYSRRYCHLCQEMLAALGLLRDEVSFAVEVIDVDSDAGLVRRFDELVPVLMHGERELSRHRLDVPGLRAYLAKIG